MGELRHTKKEINPRNQSDDLLFEIYKTLTTDTRLTGERLQVILPTVKLCNITNKY